MNTLNKYTDENLYTFLELPNFSSMDDVKKSFRKLSLKYHPDKNNVSLENKKKHTQLFQKLKDIYTYLLEHKETYDTILQKRTEKIHTCTTNGNDWNETSSMNYSHMFHRYIIDIEIPLCISLSEAFAGIVKPVEIHRTITTIYVRNNQQIVDNYDIKQQEEKEVIYVECYKGIDKGETIVIQQKGNTINLCNTSIKSNVKIHIHLQPHTYFKRNGLDLIYTKHIQLVEALTDFSFILHHINGKQYILSNENKIIHMNDTKVIEKLGFQRNTYVGNLIIEFIILFPQHLSVLQKRKIKEILQNG